MYSGKCYTGLCNSMCGRRPQHSRRKERERGYSEAMPASVATNYALCMGDDWEHTAYLQSCARAFIYWQIYSERLTFRSKLNCVFKTIVLGKMVSSEGTDIWSNTEDYQLIKMVKLQNNDSKILILIPYYRGLLLVLFWDCTLENQFNPMHNICEHYVLWVKSRFDV